MIEGMIERVKRLLPLLITEVNWDGTYFQIYGESWHFNALCCWRISTKEKVIFGCYDEISHQEIKNIYGLKIVEIEVQNPTLKVDPVFVLSNGFRVEIFSTDTFEPWTLQVEGLSFFTATPGEPSAFSKDVD